MNSPQRSVTTPTESAKAIQVLTGILGLGLVVVIIFAFQMDNVWSAATICLTIAGASLLVGGLLGFLFGIPRTLQDGPVEVRTPTEAAANANAAPIIQYRANTNLEQISDWLTKILVGVGLTKISEIPDKLQIMSQIAAKGLGGSDASVTFITAGILYFAINGFLFGYLWTRLFLPGAFRQADVLNLVERVSVQDEKIRELEKKQSMLNHEQ